MRADVDKKKEGEEKLGVEAGSCSTVRQLLGWETCNVASRADLDRAQICAPTELFPKLFPSMYFPGTVSDFLCHLLNPISLSVIMAVRTTSREETG